MDGDITEAVHEYNYLGQIISFHNKIEKEVCRRISIGWNKYWQIKKFFKNNKVDNTYNTYKQYLQRQYLPIPKQYLPIVDNTYKNNTYRSKVNA